MKFVVEIAGNAEVSRIMVVDEATQEEAESKALADCGSPNDWQILHGPTDLYVLNCESKEE